MKGGASVGVGFLAAAGGVQLLYVTRPLWFLNQNVLTVDDAYYFLQVARNIARLGWATFDGLHATSGVQFLWVALLSVLAMVFDERMALVRAALVLSVLLNIATGLTLRRFGTLLHSSEVGETVAVLWGMVMLWAGTTLTGMEYALHAAIVAASLLCWWLIMTGAPILPSRTMLLGILATLNYWARIDSAVISLAILVTASLRLLVVDSSGWRKNMVRLWAVPAAGAVGYLALSRAMAGTLMPISGVVKSLYAAQHFDGYPWWVALAGHVSWWCRIQVQPVIDLVAAAFGLHVGTVLPPVVVAFAGMLAILGTFWSARWVWIAGDDRTKRAALFVAALWLLAALHSAIVVFQIGHFSHVTRHYYGWLLIAWCLWVAVLLGLAWHKASDSSARRGAFRVLFGAVVVFQTVGVANTLRAPVDHSELRNTRTALIGWIDSNLPADAPVAAWNAGQLGYFLNRPVVNLDGIVNDREFLEFLRLREPISNYLNRQGVRYLVDYNDPDLSMPYRAAWDKSRLFRNEIPWSDVDTLLERKAADRAIYVLRRKQVIRAEVESRYSPD